MTRTVSALAIAAVLGSAASAEYVPVEVENVPIERLTKNLEAAVAKDPASAGAVLNLARAHAMAYALRSETVPVRKKQPDDLWFGYEPVLVPFRAVVPTKDPERLKAATTHLAAALKLYGDALKLKPDDLIAKLGQAWLLSQTENKVEAVAALRGVLEKGWEEYKVRKDDGLLGLAVVAEGTGYLVPLLDAVKDKEEIATLRQRALELEKHPRPITPIAVPLKAGLGASDLEDLSARVRFDADGTGVRKEWTWIRRDAAWLVHDPRRTGRITSGLQLFGSVTFWMFWETGYDALSALDDDRDGRLSGRELDGLALWEDADANGVSDPGEVRSLSAHGIVAISCRHERLTGHPDRIASSPKGITFSDGSTRPTYDLVLHPR